MYIASVCSVYIDDYIYASSLEMNTLKGLKRGEGDGDEGVSLL